MSVAYEYTGIATKPDVEGIMQGVADSAMTDKSIEYCNWDQTTEILNVYFTNTLSGGDKTILDGIIANPPSPNPQYGITLVSSNGTHWRVIVDDEGVLTTEEVQ